MVQELLIFIIFTLAAAYMGRMFYRSFSTKGSSCAKGCGGACSSIDFNKIQKNLEQRTLSKETR